jgi:hypothetical protein
MCTLMSFIIIIIIIIIIILFSKCVRKDLNTRGEMYRESARAPLSLYISCVMLCLREDIIN